MPKHATSTTYKKGHPPSKPKGAVSKFTTLKQAFVDSFQHVGAAEALNEFYKNPKNRRYYLQMISSMLPKDVQLSGSLDLRVNNIKGIIDNANGSGGNTGGISSEVREDNPELGK